MDIADHGHASAAADDRIAQRHLDARPGRSLASGGYGAAATAIPQGLPPRLMRRSTAPLATSTIDTSPAGPLAVNSFVPSALMPMPHGRWPTSATCGAASASPRRSPTPTGPAVRHEQQFRVRRQHRAHRPRRRRRGVGLGIRMVAASVSRAAFSTEIDRRVLVGDEQVPPSGVTASSAAAGRPGPGRASRTTWCRRRRRCGRPRR